VVGVVRVDEQYGGCANSIHKGIVSHSEMYVNSRHLQLWGLGVHTLHPKAMGTNQEKTLFFLLIQL
jgi:hypothetical protein